MKKIKKIFVSIVAVIMLCVSAMSFSACEDIKKLQVNIKVNDTEYTMEVALYKHLAPETCNAVIENVNNGYYNNLLFYKLSDSVITSEYNKQILVGDIAYKNNAFEFVNGSIETVKGEFESNGVSGSNLINKKGSVGLYRETYVSDTSAKTSSTARNTGKATWYLPTETLSSYDGYYCVFGQIDLDNQNNADALNAITGIFSNSDNYTEYVVYYTKDGETLTPNFVSKKEYNEKDYTVIEDGTKLTYLDGETEKSIDIYKAEGEVARSYNLHKVYLPVVDGTVKAQIVSVKLK